VLTNPEYSKYLERNFTVRFRCLLDNTSGFLTLDIIGRLGLLHGQRSSAFQLNSNGDIINTQIKTYSKGNKNTKPNNNNASVLNDSKNEEPMLALFAIACPFGPPSLFELPQRDSIFKTKHKISLSPVSLDAK
jgi:aryl hydrocarbon receptor